MLPSEYFKRQCYIALDVDEEPAVDVVNKGRRIFRRVDGLSAFRRRLPRGDRAVPEPPLTDEQRRKILWDNAPASTRSRDLPGHALTAPPQASAAE